MTPITFTPVALTNCQLLWGLLLDRLSPVATNIGTPFMACPPAAFGTRQGPSQFTLQNYINGNHDAVTGADTMFLPELRTAAASARANGTPASSSLPSRVKPGGTTAPSSGTLHAEPAESGIER